MKRTSDPYESIAFEASLRAEFNIRFSEDPGALKDVAVIGALHTTRHEIFREDAMTVAEALRALNESNIPVHWTSRFYFYNLMPPIGSDFLQRNCTPLLPDGVNPIPSDIVITCGLCDSAPGAWNTFETFPGYKRVGFEHFEDALYNDHDRFPDRNRYVNRATAVSPLQSDGMWSECTANVGARIVITRGGGDEIGTKTFEGGPYRALIDTKEGFARQHGLGIGGALGILAHQDYLQGLKGVFNEKRRKPPLLAARIYDAVRRLPSAQRALRTGQRVNRLA